MKRNVFLLIAIATFAGATALQTGHANQESAPVFVTEIPQGYRDWKLVSVAHEEGNLNDIRAILGNEVAIATYREGKLPFPEGAIIGRIAWRHVSSEENNKVFGRAQSFVPGDAPPWYLQFMVKDSKKYAATGGWGYAQFDKDGKPGPEADMKKCFPVTRPSKIATSCSHVTRINKGPNYQKEYSHESNQCCAKKQYRHSPVSIRFSGC